MNVTRTARWRSQTRGRWTAALGTDEGTLRILSVGVRVGRWLNVSVMHQGPHWTLAVAVHDQPREAIVVQRPIFAHDYAGDDPEAVAA